ncbi:MAG: 2-hydroxyacyl-CoA dehydratase [Chloroflexi bacterium]|nr:2-hydroxyacyl-CoA dehydratase [Chloroflexota bacterium]
MLEQKKVGLVTTIPVEVIFAAEAVPVDLNNIFITAPEPAELVDQAELDGFPRNICSWVKGIYSAALAHNVGVVIAVMRGDCSNNEAMAEVLRAKGVEVIPFSFPYPRDGRLLQLEIERLMRYFDVDWAAVNRTQRELDAVRALVHRLDALTWQTDVVTGFENHLWGVSCSDFDGDYRVFQRELSALLAEKEALLQGRDAVQPANRAGSSSRDRGPLRLGFVGVPPIFTDMYEYLESLGTRVVYNEMQRQFAMPGPADRDLAQLYLDYTYPYDFADRIADIRIEVAQRGVDGLIHYVQSFCHHQIQDIVLRQQVKLPILTLEGDRPGPLDARSKMRLEAFVDLCRQRAVTSARSERGQEGIPQQGN